MQEAKSRIEQVIDLCTEGKFTGVLRVDSPIAQGEVQFLSGIRDEVRFGISTGAEALARMIQAPNPRCETVPSLPNPRGGFKKGLPQEGPLSEMRGIDLMHYCETYALTCTLELAALGHKARAIYRIGELVSIELLDQVSDSDTVIADLLQASEGTYRFTLPPFELPEVFRTASLRPPKPQDWLQNLVGEIAAAPPATSPPAAAGDGAARASAVSAAETETKRAQAEATQRAAQAEAKRKADEADAQRKAEAARAGEQKRQADAVRAAEAKRQADAMRAAEATRQAEAKRAAEAELARSSAAEAKRAAEAEVQRAAEAEVQRAAEAEVQRAAEAEVQRAAKAEAARQAEAEAARALETEAARKREAPATATKATSVRPAAVRPVSSSPPPKPVGASMTTWIVIMIVVMVVLAAFALRLLR